ncbi:MAG: APC family permease [Candidatus Zipacnadales bacterium]
MIDGKSLRQWIFGRPLPSSRAAHERLNVLLGLPVFASDAISSVAYATEEILLGLVLAGTSALSLSVPIAVVIVFVMLLVVISYQQIIKAHPEGGGAYTVALTRLGRTGGLFAGSALLIDYVLTVAVSISSGIENVASAWPRLHEHKVLICVLAIGTLTWLNLRGVRESAKAVAGPVFAFIIAVLGLILFGTWRFLTGTAEPLLVREVHATHPLSLFLILHAFASGCVALTGIEAISNGVQAFRDPAPRNARITLGILAGILATFFIGLTFLARVYNVVPELGKETVLSMLGHAIFGHNLAYLVLQVSTLVILLLAANTAFAGFPRLASLLARDGFLPRQLSNLGDRLVFSNGIIVLGLAAAALVIIFRGSTHSLIPLYAIGVFLSFSLAQGGMLRSWITAKPRGWWTAALANGIGGVATTIVLVVVSLAKFIYGAWMILIALPLVVCGFRRIRAHYDRVAEQLTMDHFVPPGSHATNLIIVPVASLHRGTYHAVEYAQSLGPPVKAVHVITDQAAWEALQQAWKKWESDVELIGLPTPYRSLVTPLVEYVREQRDKYDHVTVVIPEFVVTRWWEELLHNQSAIVLDLALRRLMHVSVVNFRYQLQT